MNISEINRLVYEQTRARNLVHQVGASGAVSSHIAVVAEAPGERELNMKVPLCGGSGKLLWDSLRKYDLNRQQVYVTNVVKRRVSLSKGENALALAKGEQELWEQVINYELSLLPECRIILVLGDMALHALTGHAGITKWRGSVLTNTRLRLSGSEREYTVVVVNNPAAALHDSREEVIFRFHIGKLHRVLQGKFKEHSIDAHINPVYSEAVAYLDALKEEAHVHGTPVSYDIETPNGEVGCIGFANNAHTGMCINLRTLSDNTFTLEEEVALWQHLQAFMADERIKFIAQNGMYDSTFNWYKTGLRVHKHWFDTMLAHHTLYNALPHDLGFLTTAYTDHPYYKDEKDNWKEKGEIDRFWEYNVKDCCLTWAVHEGLMRELKRDRLEDFFFNHVMRANPHLASMGVGGVLCNVALKQSLIDDLTENAATVLNRFHSLVAQATGDATYMPNPLSHPQMRDLLFTRLKLTGRGTSVDKDNRKLMLNHPRTNELSKQIIYAMDEYLKESKFISTYAEMKVDEDNRLRCEYKQHGVASAPGRLSSAATGWGAGGNLQNIPSRAYPMFIADPGYCFVYFDLSQAEARVVGWKARIQAWIDDFERARLGGTFDCHRSLAAQMYNVPYEQVPEKDEDEHGEKTIRYYAKRSRHGFNYRLGPDTFSIKNNMPIARSIELHNIYLRTNPELLDWWDSVERTIHDKRMLVNAYGRRLIYLNQVQQDDVQTGIAFYPQSTVGDHVTSIIYKSHDDDAWPHDARIVLNIHDALIALTPLHKAKDCLRIMKRHAESPIDIDGMPLIIPADCKMSVPDDNGVHSWATLKKVEIEL